MFTEHLFYAPQLPCYLILMATLRGGCYYSHFTGGEIEAQRGQITCPKPSKLASFPILFDSLALSPKAEIWESKMLLSSHPPRAKPSWNVVGSALLSHSFQSLSMATVAAAVVNLRPLYSPACSPLTPFSSCPISNQSSQIHIPLCGTWGPGKPPMPLLYRSANSSLIFFPWACTLAALPTLLHITAFITRCMSSLRAWTYLLQLTSPVPSTVLGS